MFIDGHSHSTQSDIAEETNGTGMVGDTILTSTGTKLESVGVVDIAADGDAVGNFHIAVDHIPAAAPFSRLVVNHGDIVRSLFLAVFVQIFHII